MSIGWTRWSTFYLLRHMRTGEVADTVVRAVRSNCRKSFYDFIVEIVNSVTCISQLEQRGCFENEQRNPPSWVSGNFLQDVDGEMAEDARCVSFTAESNHEWIGRALLIQLPNRGTIVAVGGPLFVQSIRPSDEELFSVSFSAPIVPSLKAESWSAFPMLGTIENLEI